MQLDRSGARGGDGIGGNVGRHRAQHIGANAPECEAARSKRSGVKRARRAPGLAGAPAGLGFSRTSTTGFTPVGCRLRFLGAVAPAPAHAKAVAMPAERIWTAALVVIGDEILSGRTQDKNVAQIAIWLNMQGIRLAEVRVVADDQAAIVEAVNKLRARNDYLFTTGGIGPTHDDITVDAIAAALGVDVEVHPKARAVLESYYATRGGLTDARLRMARVPAGATLIENRTSGAPGIRHGNIFIMAGVPHITAG